MKPKATHSKGWAPALGYANGMLMTYGTLHTGAHICWDKEKRGIRNLWLMRW